MEKWNNSHAVVGEKTNKRAMLKRFSAKNLQKPTETYAHKKKKERYIRNGICMRERCAIVGYFMGINLARYCNINWKWAH